MPHKHDPCDTKEKKHVLKTLKAESETARLHISDSVALVRERTILAERRLLVGEIAAKFCRERVSRGQRDRSPRSYSSFS
jgi:hypothetical protein